MATPTPPTLDHEPGASGPRRLDGSFDALLDILWVTERKNVIRRKIPREKRPRVKAHRRLEMRLKDSFKTYLFDEDSSNPGPWPTEPMSERTKREISPLS